MLRLINTLFNTRPVVTHCPGPPLEGWRYFAEAVFADPVVPRPARESWTLITWNHGARPEKPNGILEHCVARYGAPVLVLGRGIEPWHNIRKLQLTADALRDVRTEFVIGLDSADVLLVDHPDEIVSRFRQEFACELLYNATGSACWPELPQYVMYESSRPEAAGLHGRHWLNSGAFVGRTEFCRNYFAAQARTAERGGFIGDQQVVKETWPEWYPRVQIDGQSRIFQWFREERRFLHIERPRTAGQQFAAAQLRTLPSLRYATQVGVGDGALADALLQDFPRLTLWLVDRWGPSASTGNSPEADFAAQRGDLQHRMALWWTSHAEHRRYELRTGAATAAGKFPDGSLDAVVVQPDPDPAAERYDLQPWWSKLRTGGRLCVVAPTASTPPCIAPPAEASSRPIVRSAQGWCLEK